MIESYIRRKFWVKGWSDSEHRWIEGFVIIGSRVIGEKDGLIIPEIMILPDPAAFEINKKGQIIWHVKPIIVDPRTICRYAGVRTKARQKVYEYDIVKFKSRDKTATDMVVNRRGEWRFKRYPILVGDTEILQIVGNYRLKYRNSKKGRKRPIIRN